MFRRAGIGGLLDISDFYRVQRHVQLPLTSEGTYIGYQFDDLNRMVYKNLQGSEPDVTYTYDLLGRMTGASQSGGPATIWTFDALARQRRQTTPLNLAGNPPTRRDYDAAGRLTKLTYPDGNYVEYDRYLTGEVKGVRENGAASGAGVLAIYGLDDWGRRSSLTSIAHDLAGTGNDVTISLTYNAAGQIRTRTVSNDLHADPFGRPHPLCRVSCGQIGRTPFAAGAPRRRLARWRPPNPCSRTRRRFARRTG